MTLGLNVDRNYNYNIDDKIIEIIRIKNSCYKNELFRELQKYFPTISKKTRDRHLHKMVAQTTPPILQ